MALFYSEPQDLNQRERDLKAALVKEAQKMRPDEKVMENLRKLLEQVRMQLGHSASESGRVYPSEPPLRPMEQKPATNVPIADPSAPLRILGQQGDVGAALRIHKDPQK